MPQSAYASRMRTTPLGDLLLLSVLALAAGPRLASAQATLPTDFVDELVVGGLSAPTNMAFLPDGRLLFVELLTARVRMVDGTALGSPDPMVVVDSVSSDAEQGLLGIAVDPDWPARPYVYVQYTQVGQRGRITRYTASGDLDGSGDRSLALDPTSRRVVLQYPDDNLRHNGASLHFGPDGMLYSSLGDDLFDCAAQDIRLLKGKILRLDMSRIPAGAGPPPPNALIAPPDNPFAAHADSNARLVYAYGLRNPFSFGIDPLTGDLFIADVGTSLYEELNWAHSPGMNFGWPYWEGPVRRAVGCTNADTNFAHPIASYEYTGPNSIITAGVYRPPDGATQPFPLDHWGDLFFNEFYEPFVRRLNFDGASWQPASPAPGQPNKNDWAAGLVYWIPAWAIAPDGALYYARMWVTYPNPDGQIRRIGYTGTVHVPPPSPPARAEPLVAHPVPATGPVRFSFTLERPGIVQVAVYDVRGRLVREVLRHARRSAGPTEIVWDGRDDTGLRVPAGLYLALLRVDDFCSARRLAILR